MQNISRKISSISSLFNPLILLSIQTLLALIMVPSAHSRSLLYIFQVVAPYMLFLLYYIITAKIIHRGRRFNKPSFNYYQKIVSGSMVVLASLVNLWLIFQMLPFYGGVQGAISNAGAAEIATYLQQRGPNSIREPIIFNYLLTVSLIPIIFFRSRIRFIIIPLALLLSFVAASLYGARTLFIEPLLSIVIVKSLYLRTSFKNILTTLTLISAVLMGMFYLQSIRSGGRGFADGAEVLYKYYSISLIQGSTVIVNDMQKEPLFWTLSSLFGIPVISKIFGFSSVYEGIFGSLPITTREDAFDYVSNLGADPNFNTLGIYAYTYLDAGSFGILLLFLIFSIGGVAYVYFRKGHQLGIILFPAIFLMMADQLRTASIFSARMPYFIIFALIIYITGILFKEERKFQASEDPSKTCKKERSND